MLHNPSTNACEDSWIDHLLRFFVEDPDPHNAKQTRCETRASRSGEARSASLRSTFPRLGGSRRLRTERGSFFGESDTMTQLSACDSYRLSLSIEHVVMMMRVWLSNGWRRRTSVLVTDVG